LLISSVLHLMSHYTAGASQLIPCIKLASSIERHLVAIAASSAASPIIRATCDLLSQQWADIVAREMPAQKKTRLLARWRFGMQG
jgi:hypothetical protein